MAKIRISVPSLEEQQQIADFLDHKTAQTDDLIQKKEEMIKLLKEKRAAIINQAVTKGLDPNAKMKPSGIDWRGYIPEGWQVLRLKYKISLDPSKNEVLKIISLDDDVTFLPMAYVTEGGDINDENEKKLEDVFSGYTYFRDNDVVVAKITPCFENGKGALIKGMKNGIGFGTTEFFVLRSKSLDEKYLFYLTKSDYFRKIGEASMKGAAGQKRIPDSFIKDLKIGFPEQTEQKRIANYLDKKTTEIDDLIQKFESVIVKLREYRSSLITAVVTGKIDVRG
ncbi:MAG: restriction endonuclease subunit S [Planctomycetes bacterium]|nr:restriction endonuclease subunit S [Planctomycetota bacterium]